MVGVTSDAWEVELQGAVSLTCAQAQIGTSSGISVDMRHRNLWVLVFAVMFGRVT